MTVSPLAPEAPELSVVIPAFNEEKRLGRTLLEVDAYCRSRRLVAEIVVVNDGSSDGTGPLARAFAARQPVRVLDNPGNRGKGYSVRHGMQAARGREILFTDADLSAPISEVEKLRAALAQDADIAIGSRAHRELIRARQSRFREMSGRLFNWLVVATLGLRFKDTQCGFKLFRREAAEAILPLQRVEGWGFDPEMLYLARRRGLRVVEVPVLWSHTEGAKIHVLRDGVRMFLDVLRIRWNALRGRYSEKAPSRSASAP